MSAIMMDIWSNSFTSEGGLSYLKPSEMVWLILSIELAAINLKGQPVKRILHQAAIIFSFELFESVFCNIG